MSSPLRLATNEGDERVFETQLAQLERAWVSLPDKPDETPLTTLRALWFASAGDPCSVERAAMRELPELDRDGRATLHRLVGRRLSGVPLAHITGRQSFMGLELLAGPEALVPRRETELLGYSALALLRKTVADKGCALVVDVCTGSGNLALALAHHERGCEVIGGDLSAEAVSLARRNAEWTALTERVGFVQGDLFAPFDALGVRGAVDFVVCNPPYISSSKAAVMPTEIAGFEPRLAFDGGAFGVSILFRLVSVAAQFLKPGSWLCVEVGRGQGDAMAARLERAGTYRLVERIRDDAGDVRVLLAQTHASGTT
jgi:release factor glutamine methyltransferase